MFTKIWHSGYQIIGFNLTSGIKPNKKKSRCEIFSELKFIDKRSHSVVKHEQNKRERVYKNTVIDKKLESLERIENRKLERKILQYKYNQPLGRRTDLREIHHFKEKDKHLLDLLSTKRSITFRDPTKPLVHNKNPWEAFNALSSTEVK